MAILQFWKEFRAIKISYEFSFVPTVFGPILSDPQLEFCFVGKERVVFFGELPTNGFV